MFFLVETKTNLDNIHFTYLQSSYCRISEEHLVLNTSWSNFRKGKKVVCYFSAGTAEEWRPDYSDFPRDALGDPDPNWERERWVDIRDTR